MIKIKSKKNPRRLLSKSPYVRRNEEEMELIVGKINSGSLSILAACRKYGLNRNTLKLWMTRLTVGSLTDKLNKSITSSMEDDKKVNEYKQQVLRLEKALEYSRLKILGLETMIKVAEEDLQIKIKKKHGTKQSKK